MKKKLISMMLCAAMVVSACACGNTADEEKGKTTSEETKVQESTQGGTAEGKSSAEQDEEEEPTYPIVDEQITVKGLLVDMNTEQGDTRIVWDEVSELTGIQFEWIFLDSESLAVYLAGGDWDFDFIHYSLDSTLVNDYGVEGGMFADYTDYLQYMPNLQAVFEEYPEALKAVKESNGEIYRLPMIEKSATATQARAYYRTDMLEEAGLDMPATTEELYEALKVLKEKNGGAAPFSGFGLNETGYWGLMLYSAFGPSVNANFEDDGTGTVVFNRTSEQYKHYLEYMHKLYAEGLINQEYLTLDYAGALALTQSGETAFLGMEAHSLGAADFEDGEFHLSAVTPLTSEYDSERKVLGQLPVSLNGFFLNAESEYLVEMCKVFDIMFADEEVVEGSGLYGMSFCYGLENEHWKYSDNGEKTYEFITPEGYDGSFTNFQYNELIFTNAGLVTALEGYTATGNSNSVARQKAFVNNVIPYHCADSEVFPENFLKFTSDEQYVITNKYTDIQSYYTEMTSKFITGVEDIDTKWDEYCETFEVMGIDEVLAAYQAAYDRWNQ